MEHVGLFGILANLIVALWVAIFVYQNHKSYNDPFLLPFFHYSVFYSVLVFVGLVALYVELNLQRNLQNVKLPLLQDVSFLLVSFLEIGLVYSMFRVFMGFKGKDLSKPIKKWLTVGLAVFVLTYGLKIFLPQGSILSFLNIFHGNVFDNMLLFEIVVLILILIPGKKVADRKRIKLRRSFGWFFLLRYIIIIGIFIIFVVFVSNASEVIPRAVRYPLALVLVLFFSLAPVIWIKFYFRKYAESMLLFVEDRKVLDSVFEKYGISKREQDILKLILDGKSNKDIEETLFISYHTVKNHVYNLYQKLGVKSRYELVHFITKYQKG